MYSPKDETTRARMEDALATASSHLATAPTGPLSWGWLGRTVGSRTENGHWLRVHCGEAAKTPTTRNEGIALAEERVSDKVSRPHPHDLYRWGRGEYVFEAELIDYVAQPVISPETPDLTKDPGLPDSWWATLRESLDALSAAEPPRETIRQSWADRVFPEFLGIPAPTSPNASPATPISSGPTSPTTPSSSSTGNAGAPSPSATTRPCSTSTAFAFPPSPHVSAPNSPTSWTPPPAGSANRSPSPKCSRPSAVVGTGSWLHCCASARRQ